VAVLDKSAGESGWAAGVWVSDGRSCWNKKNTEAAPVAGHTPIPWSITEAGGISGDGEVIILNHKTKERGYAADTINNGFGLGPEAEGDKCWQALEKMNAALELEKGGGK
jgi:hypothetical protein